MFTCYFKMVFVSLGAPRRERKGEGVQLPASCLPAPQKDNIPMLLLLQEPHLTTLFDLLEMLASFKPPPAEVAMEDSEVILIKVLRHKLCFMPGSPTRGPQPTTGPSIRNRTAGRCTCVQLKSKKWRAAAHACVAPLVIELCVQAGLPLV